MNTLTQHSFYCITINSVPGEKQDNDADCAYLVKELRHWGFRGNHPYYKSDFITTEQSCPYETKCVYVEGVGSQKRGL